MSGVNSELKKLADSVLELVLKPALQELIEESGRPIRMKVVTFSSCVSQPSIEFMQGVSHGDGVTANGEARVFLKDVGYPCNFMLEAIFDDLFPGTGFSGFSMRGRLRLDGGAPTVKLTARTNRYNVREWSKDFAGI